VFTLYFFANHLVSVSDKIVLVIAIKAANQVVTFFAAQKFLTITNQHIGLMLIDDIFPLWFIIVDNDSSGFWFQKRRKCMLLVLRHSKKWQKEGVCCRREKVCFGGFLERPVKFHVA
jgi:hypothetical protein